MAGRSKTRRPPTARLLTAAGVFVAVCALLASAAMGAHYYSWLSNPVIEDGDAVTLVIPDGTNWSGVVDILGDHGLIERPLYFELWARERELPAAVKAGAYLFEGPMTLAQLDQRLRQGGAVEEVRLTIPEGFTIFHIADRIERLGLASRTGFLSAARDADALASAGIPGESFEGYLFPETYRFVKGTPPELIVETLHEEWAERYAALANKNTESVRSLEDTYAFDRHAIVTMASIVEKETSANGEGKTVARVFYNRLDRDMRLQTDPTCVYGETTYREVPHPRYCKDPLNRYSTYVIDGLPPGPIANPGEKALRATMAPDDSPEAMQYLFFVARRDGSGGHHFSKTFKEHKKAIRQFLRRR